MTSAVWFVQGFRSDAGGLASLGRRSGFVAIGFRFGRDGRYTHNLISKPHSVPPYTPYTTELVVAGSKAYCNDQL